MDITTSARSDTLPAVGSMIVPGAVAATPHIALLWGPPHNLKGFVDANQGASTAAAALLVVSVGLLVESVGSYFEYYVIDRRHPNRDAMLQRWWNYLQIAWKVEPIGHRYLRRILTVFKFELNLLVAALATLPGVAFLGWYGVLPQHGLLAVVGFILGLCAYLYRATVASSLLLDTLREKLVTQARATGELKPETEVVSK